jgi:hypothetical protein
MSEGPIRRPEGGGSEWEPIKNSSPKRELGLYPKSQLRIPTRVCQGHVVATDLPTLRTNPKRSQRGSTKQEATDLAVLQEPWRTVRSPGADGPRSPCGRSTTHGGLSVKHEQNDPTGTSTRGRFVDVRADSPRRPGGRSAKHPPVKSNWPTGSKPKCSRTRDEHEEHPDECDAPVF